MYFHKCGSSSDHLYVHDLKLTDVVTGYWYDENSITVGCTDETAINYNSQANVDNGSCEYLGYGCTDILANNYNENAYIDDGSCEYYIVVDSDLFYIENSDNVQFTIENGYADLGGNSWCDAANLISSSPLYFQDDSHLSFSLDWGNVQYPSFEIFYSQVGQEYDWNSIYYSNYICETQCGSSPISPIEYDINLNSLSNGQYYLKIYFF